MVILGVPGGLTRLWMWPDEERTNSLVPPSSRVVAYEARHGTRWSVRAPTTMESQSTFWRSIGDPSSFISDRAIELCRNMSRKSACSAAGIAVPSEFHARTSKRGGSSPIKLLRTQ